MRNHTKIYEMTICACLAGLAIVLNLPFCSINTGFTKLTFYGLPLLFSGIMFGRKQGCITGLITGVVLQLISEYGIGLTSIVWALAPICWGYFSGLFYKVLDKVNDKMKILLIVLFSSLIAYIANTLGFFADYLAYKQFNPALLTRLLAMPITIPVYSVFLYLLNKKRELFTKN